ncbi:MAG: hypothetical protein IT369_09785 [Candidatus Latescibacteria bacterium]|nr:hypothetical protein [Candidatus Latescibacterota bacterium]
MTSIPELTTRDVLQQVDRRLSLIEEDLRGLDAKVDAKINALDMKFEARLDVLDAKIDTKINALDAKFEAKLDSRFNLVIGLILASWFSMMGAFLLK